MNNEQHLQPESAELPFPQESCFPYTYSPSSVHRLIPHQLVHQIRKRPIRIHQLRRRTDKVIRKVLHASKKAVLENIVRAVHPVGNLGRESDNGRQVSRG